MDLLVGINRNDDILPKSGTGTVTDLSNLPYPPGYVWTDPNTEDKFKFVLFEDVAVVQGNSCRYTTDHNGYEVSADATGGVADAAFAAGIAVGADGVTDGNFGWIQIAGRNTVAVVTDAGVVADVSLMAHGSTNGGFDTSTAARSAEFGWATEDDTGTALAIGTVFLDITQQ